MTLSDKDIEQLNGQMDAVIDELKAEEQGFDHTNIEDGILIYHGVKGDEDGKDN